MNREFLVLTTLVSLAAAGCGSGNSGPGEAAGEAVRPKEVVGAAFTGATDNLQPGWNAVGLRGLPVTSIQGTNIAGFAYWDGTAYQTKSLTLEEVNANGGTRRGLWVFATGTGNITYSATDPSAVSLDLKAGWNLVAFPYTRPLQGHDFVARISPTTIVPLGQVLLPQFNEIQPDRTYRQVDVTTGGSVQPGKAYWVFASQSVALSYGSSTPTPSPSPGLTPTPASSPSPSATPTPASSPSPGASPTPAASPLGSNNLQRISPITAGANYEITPMFACSADADFVTYRESIGGSGYRGYVADLTAGTRGELRATTEGEDPAEPVISSDASTLGYWAEDLGTPSILQSQVFKENRATTALTWVSQEPQSEAGVANTPRVSGDGRYFIYRMGAPGVTGVRLIVRDTNPGGSGTVLNISSPNNDFHAGYDISDDGRYICFTTSMALVPEDTDTSEDLYHYDRQESITRLVAAQANSFYSYVSMSATGRYVVFSTQATNIVAGTSLPGQIYRYDNETGAIVKVSTTPAGVDANFTCEDPSISLDGRYVAFETVSTNLANDPDADDIYVKDVTSGALARVSVKADGTPPNSGYSRDPSISDNGRYIVFLASGTGLVPGEPSGGGIYRALNVLKP